MVNVITVKIYFWCFRFNVFLADSQFYISHPEQNGWTHVVLNYIGPNNGEGIRIFYDGQEVVSDTDMSEGSYSAVDGRIVVGRYYTSMDERYWSIQIDELIFFNQALQNNDIAALYILP